MDAIAASATKRAAAAMLGVTASHISSVVHAAADRSLGEAWRRLPSDGAFAGMSSGLPKPSLRQAEADQLLAEVCTDNPINPEGTQRDEVVLVLLAAANIVGGLNLPRGWVRATILAFEAARHPTPPSSNSLRWYRARLMAEPEMFREVRGADPEVMTDLVERANRS